MRPPYISVQELSTVFSLKGSLQTGNIKQENKAFNNICQVNYKIDLNLAFTKSENCFLNSHNYIKKHILVLLNHIFSYVFTWYRKVTLVQNEQNNMPE